jgi:hypothetical protein
MLVDAAHNWAGAGWLDCSTSREDHIFSLQHLLASGHQSAWLN